MALTVTTVNGGEGRVVLGANGRPAHIIELGPVYLRLDVSDGFDTVLFPAGGLSNSSFAMMTMAMYTAGAARRGQRRHAGVGYISSATSGGIALGMPALDLSLFNGSFAMTAENMYMAGARRRAMRHRAGVGYVNQVSPGGGLALGVPA